MIFFNSLLCSFGIPLYKISEFVIFLLKNISNALLYVNPTLNMPSFNPIILFIYIMGLFIFLYYLYKGIGLIYKKAIFVSLCLISIHSLPIDNIVSQEVMFINVGQGNATLIRDGLNTILIDTGGNHYKDIANDNLIPFFKKNRIYKIDLLISTHDDFDHIGALSALEKNFKIREYIYSKDNFPLSINGLTINNLNYYPNPSDDNETSLVLSFNLMHKSFLIMGDADIKVEQYIMNKYKDAGIGFKDEERSFFYSLYGGVYVCAYQVHRGGRTFLRDAFPGY